MQDNEDVFNRNLPLRGKFSKSSINSVLKEKNKEYKRSPLNDSNYSFNQTHPMPDVERKRKMFGGSMKLNKV